MSNERIDLTQWKNEHREVYACCESGEHYTDVLLAELKRCYELIDELEERPLDDEVENYPEPDERIPPNTTRAGADWPSGPRM